MGYLISPQNLKPSKRRDLITSVYNYKFYILVFMVHLFLANGFEEIEALTTLDILRRAAIPVETVSISGSRNVTGAHGVTVKADSVFRKSELVKSDCLILPGGMPGADNLRMHPGVCQAVKKQVERGAYVAAICAAPSVVLGTCGLLQGKKATTYPGFEDKSHGAHYTKKGIEADGTIITAKAPGFTFEFAFTIVEALKGSDVVKEVKKGMCLSC